MAPVLHVTEHRGEVCGDFFNPTRKSYAVANGRLRNSFMPSLTEYFDIREAHWLNDH
jgi:hypothetical protein